MRIFAFPAVWNCDPVTTVACESSFSHSVNTLFTSVFSVYWVQWVEGFDCRVYLRKDGKNERKRHGPEAENDIIGPAIVRVMEARVVRLMGWQVTVWLCRAAAIAVRRICWRFPSRLCHCCHIRKAYLLTLHQSFVSQLFSFRLHQSY